MPLVLVIGDQRVPIDRKLTVGADKSCDVVVSGLAGIHARLELGDEWTLVQATGENEVTVNGVRVADGEARVLLPGDQLLFGPATARVAYEETNVPIKTAELALAAINRVRDTPRIVVVAGKSVGAHFDLVDEGKAVRAGRTRDCDWVIDDDTLSRTHVRFVRRAGRVLVRDLESARGTFLGAARLEPQKDATWTAGASIRAGAVVFSLVMPTALDQAIAEVIGRSPADAPPAKIDEPRAELRSAKSVAPVVASTPVAPAKSSDGGGLGVKIVVAVGVLFIGGCLAVLLWVLGLFPR